MLPAKKSGNLPARRKKGTLARALTRFRATREDRIEEIGRSARLGFLIDATGSRAQTWAQAQKIQGRMFASVSGFGAMALRLVHFGGGRVSDHDWKMSAREVAAIMKGVECKTGHTQILRGLRLFLSGDVLPQAIILIGDAFEEDAAEMAALAQDLKNADIKVFAFFEGNKEKAARAFRHLADTTGGTYASFGADLPLHDLCEGVALLTAGGRNAVNKVRNQVVRRLLLTGPRN